MITVGVPWKPGDNWREMSWAHVHTRLQGVADRLIVANPDPFTRAAARNQIADAVGDGVVIFHDADMLIPDEAYAKLARKAESGRLVIGFDQYRHLSIDQTIKILHGADPWQMTTPHMTQSWSVGGVFALTVEAWREVGGMDPRFRGWGGEDFAFAHACSLVLGPIQRLGTPAVHLWHPHARGVDTAQDERNVALMARYTACTTVAQLREVQCA